jgi:hypothetical protein
MNAIADALPGDIGLMIDMPATPAKVWRACVDGYQRLRSSRVRVPVMTWCPIGFPIALDGGDLYLEIILGRRASKWDVRHIDSIVLPFRRSFKARIFLDR